MNLPVAKQLSILRKIWGGNSQGYVFLPWIPGDKQTKKERTAPGVWQECSFKWPDDIDSIEAHLKAHTHDDLFFCPNLFETANRSVQTVAWNQRVLYADLDDVDPHEIEPEYRPTMAWQTSENGYHAVWLLGKDGIGLSDEGGENHRLTIYLGADKTGWDCTQLLRVPGRINHKAERKGYQGKLLWDDGPRYNDADDFAALPEIRVVVASEDIDDAILDSIDRREAWRRLRMKVSSRCRDYMGIRDERTARDAADALGEGMSGLLWYVERELADAGASVAEIVAIVRPMAWNKFAGRHDELVRLKSEASKAVALAHDNGGQTALETPLSEVGDVSVSLDDFMSQSRPRPSWLVDRVWGAGTVGFIAGAPKSYKSWMALDMALSVATGSSFLGTFDATQGKVLYVQEEDSDIQVFDRVGKVFWGKPQEIHPWGQMICLKDGEVKEGSGTVFWLPPQGDRLMRLVVRKGVDLTSAEWQGYLAEQCEEYGYDLIVIDTLGTTSGDTDTDKSREVNKALKPLKVLAEQYGVAIAVVHHFSKAGQSGANGVSRGGHKMLGSVALHAWVETALYVSEKTELRPRVYRVGVEREAKNAPDFRFNVDVPEIGKTFEDLDSGETHGHAGWAPTIDFNVRTHDTDEETLERSARSKENGAGRPPGSRNKRPPVWKSTVMKMKQGGMTKPERGCTVMEIRERLFGDDISRQALEAQLRKAMAEGEIVKEGSKYHCNASNASATNAN